MEKGTPGTAAKSGLDISAQAGGFLPRIVSWNITYRCNLRCAHCYLEASPATGLRELTTEEGLRLIDDIATVSPGALLVLSGGEPLLREDIFRLASYASRRGLMVVLGTNGTLLDVSVASRLAESGVQGVGISLDSPTPEFHDRFRGLEGAWQQTLKGIECCQRVGLDFQVQTTVVQGNYHQIPQMIQLAHRLGARVFDLFFLICTGRGQNLSDLEPQQYESLLTLLLDSQPQYRPMLLRPRCAPYYVRLLHQRGKQEGLSYAAGCLAGVFYCRITPEGELTPCPYLPLKLGNVREEGFGFLWRTSAQLNSLRGAKLQGRCGRCEFSSLCRGCRARASSMLGCLLEEDPYCLYEPRGESFALQEDAAHNEGITPTWSPDAATRLARVPPFLRPMVKRAAEANARRKGISTITSQFLEKMRPSKAG